MEGTVFDIEADGISATKIHCLSANVNGTIRSTAKGENIAAFFKKDRVVVGHNIIRYDIPTVERLLGVTVECRVVDTLALSWYLFPNRPKHGLEDWGVTFGIPKPKVVDWENLPITEYIHRCEEDVKINTHLWELCWKKLSEIYDDEKGIWKLIDYLTFKMQCAQEQESIRWRLDLPKAEALRDELSDKLAPVTEELEAIMPKVPAYKCAKPPKKPYKKCGSLSATGLKWKELTEEHDLPFTWSEDIKYIGSYKEPNLGSVPQIKDWLFSLGWQPCTFNFKRDKETGDVRQIPQVLDNGELTDSVRRLVEKVPELAVYEGYTMIKHRLGVVEGFLKNHVDGYLQARVQGLTNTLRFKHTELVNLPAPDKPYGPEVRGCLIAPEGMELCGSDMTALEDRTKQHYMLPHDPDYVEKMMEEGYCPHVDIAVLAGYLTEEQEERHKTGQFIDDNDMYAIKAQRKKAKPVNYGGIYGQRPQGLAQSAGMPLRQAEELYDIYWERNWSVKVIAAEQKWKLVDGNMWLYNPVSELYYSLRYEKDIFSTLNQGTGVWCFDTWVKHVRRRGVKMCGQFHDEICVPLPLGKREKLERVLRNAIRDTNKELMLNRELDIDVDFGRSYSEIH